MENYTERDLIATYYNSESNTYDLEFANDKILYGLKAEDGVDIDEYYWTDDAIAKAIASM